MQTNPGVKEKTASFHPFIGKKDSSFFYILHLYSLLFGIGLGAYISTL
jgi:hypothetical protein